jgi:hypothetical protein
MKHVKWTMVLVPVLLVVLLLVSGSVALQAQESGDAPAGGNYRLSRTIAPPALQVAGGAYVLSHEPGALEIVDPSGTGTPCCCMHVPCVWR